MASLGLDKWPGPQMQWASNTHADIQRDHDPT